MKFKRYGIFIGVLALAAIVVLVTIFFMVMLYDAQMDYVLFCLGSLLLALVMFKIFIPGLFYDTVYYDETGIKIVTRKKTSAYTWNEIVRLEHISSGRGGTIGWTLVSISGEEHILFPFSGKFRKFVEENTPYLELR